MSANRARSCVPGEPATGGNCPLTLGAAVNASAASSSAARRETSDSRSTTPRAASAIARGYTSFIRLVIAIVRPLRRASDAVNVVLSPSGMPARTTRPPGRTDSSTIRTLSSLPATSNATSTSDPDTGSSGASTRSAPYRAAASRRCASDSTAITRDAPAARSNWISSNPIGPQPATHAVPPKGRCPRSSDHSATPSGSSSAPAASETESGSGYSSADGHAMTWRIMPSVAPCPANWIR
jgi:hypothetical protein